MTIGTILATLIISLAVMILTKKESPLNKIISGIFYGSTISISAILIFTLWLSYYFPG